MELNEKELKKAAGGSRAGYNYPKVNRDDPMCGLGRPAAFAADEPDRPKPDTCGSCFWCHQDGDGFICIVQE